MISASNSELITQFGKISKLMPNVLFDFVMGNLSPERQREFGEILIVLGDLLVNHAADREEDQQPTIVEAGAESADDV